VIAKRGKVMVGKSGVVIGAEMMGWENTSSDYNQMRRNGSIRLAYLEAKYICFPCELLPIWKGVGGSMDEPANESSGSDRA
jgi:hypothetical protein